MLPKRNLGIPRIKHLVGNCRKTAPSDDSAAQLNYDSRIMSDGFDSKMLTGGAELMECSRCGSHNVKTFEMAQASYNVGINSWNSFVKLWFFGPPGLFIKPTQNSVARRTSPPVKPIPGLALVFLFLFSSTLIWFIAAFMRDGFEDTETQTALIVNAVVLIVGSIIVIWDITRCVKARRNYAEKLNDWIHSWICLQCGTTYKLPNLPAT